ncbi:DCC1-like thiol-disulfide oxidoreductase family protein [Altererythrobacter sp. ZODW24]|uniref:DCC1-like thiol-disulfide oxidoreductase family protein n=1 Tax=Altererythrobacter sp. ZODW24 TaxID=2185142 RepID=UPI000DF7C2DC|nr:DCC1-like thiol-disulfide oxidoreductase family protein [Altererythrobacter sp. ZODW24]
MKFPAMTSGNSAANGWTGGQYSLFRVIFAAYLFVHFTYLAFWASDIFSDQGMLSEATLSPLIYAFPNILAIFDGPIFVTGLSIAAAVAALFFGAGKWDRIAAVFLWIVLASFVGRNPLITNPAMPYVGWMLLAHLFIPKAPYGSLAARGRPDPGNGWTMPQGIFIAGWIVLALTYSYSGYTKLLSPSWVAGENIQLVLDNPLARDWFLRDIFLAVPAVILKGLTWFILAIELLFAPLALIKRLRPWLWGGMFFVQFGFAFLLNFPDLTFAMLIFHMFTFNPAWLRSKSLAEHTLHYDGGCALCHGTVRFLLAEDREGALRFAALQSGKLDKAIGSDEVVKLGDTLVLQTGDGTILTEARGVGYLLRHLGGFWKLPGFLLGALPDRLASWLYHFIGDRRYQLFGRKADMCPILPPALLDRFS